jgi:hypothetical protein
LKGKKAKIPWHSVGMMKIKWFQKNHERLVSFSDGVLATLCAESGDPFGLGAKKLFSVFRAIREKHA